MNIPEIKVAKSAGFCFGVERAVDKVYKCIEEAHRTGLPVYTYGEIIHNEAVLGDLEEKGVHIIREEEEKTDGETPQNTALDGQTETLASRLPQEGIIIIRAHGVSEYVEKTLKESGLTVVDATCPFVKRIHKIVREASEKGETVVVFGHATHPEVRGIVGWVKGPYDVIESKEEAEAFSEPCDTSLTIVSQTTMEIRKFQETVELFALKGYNTNVANTICNATGERQKEAAEIAAIVDAMIVIGGAHSSNTRRLYEICKSKCAHTYLVQTSGDLRGRLTGRESSIGITAGASTPKNIIQEVQTYVRTGTIV